MQPPLKPPLISDNALMESLGLSLDSPIELCDVTLRDGEQSPGVVFSKEEKLEIAGMLDELGVEIIEAGFPVVSANERQCVRAVAHGGLDARVCAIARAKQEDVDAALDCDVSMVSVFAAYSDLHLTYKYRKSLDEVVEGALDTALYAKEHGLEVRFAAEDATRTPVPRLIELFGKAEELGVDYLSVADTVGILNPFTTSKLVAELREALHTPLCLHCHDDLGLSTANTLVGAVGGVKQLHATVNGIGERAGNTPLEELLTALRVHFGIDRYDLSMLTPLSKTVEKASGMPVCKNKAIVGENAFAHESGIHVAAILQHPRTYEVVAPRLVGAVRRLVVGKHTGKKALAHIIKEMGYSLDDEALCLVLGRIKQCDELKKGISCDTLRRFIEESERERGGK
ncbi:MAG: homocitrate synthase family protein [Methermicoccaceae archaeon]